MRLLIVACGLLLAACSSSSNGPNTPPLEKSTTHSSVFSRADGAKIAFTLFTPELAAGETAPLLIHSHGWGAFRLRDLSPDQSNPLEAVDTLYSELEPASAIVSRAREQGYAVISVDIRGWGESEGEVNFNNPSLEGQDLTTILDWAEERLGAHLARENGDPVIGMTGISYGAGFSNMGAMVDDRIDAIMPILAWHDLRHSMVPNDVPKSLWTLGLYFVGLPASQFSLPSELTPTIINGAFTNNAPDEFLDQLYESSTASFCEGGRSDGRGMPSGVDVLIIQGANDVLFNMYEASEQQRCYQEAGNNAHLIVIRDGHVIPGLLQPFEGDLVPLGPLEQPHINCGDQQFNLVEMGLSFFDEKLRNGPPANIPTVCISQGDTGQTLDAMPGTELAKKNGDQAQIIQDTVSINPVLTGFGVQALLGLLLDLEPRVLFDLLSDLPGDLFSLVNDLINGISEPYYEVLPQIVGRLMNIIPHEVIEDLLTFQHFDGIYTAEQGKVIAGIPSVSLELTPALPFALPLSDGIAEPIIYVGIAVKPANRAGTFLLNGQVTPLRGFGKHEVPLTGVNEQLQEGDRIGLVAMAWHPQYFTPFSRVPQPVSISGSVSLPIIDDQRQLTAVVQTDSTTPADNQN